MNIEETVTFDDGAAYEQLMRRWSTAVGTVFLDWIDAPKDADWLDVGCGTGIFTELVLGRCSPRSVVGLDPAAAQLERAKALNDDRVRFEISDAQELPSASACFDVVASALVINFIPAPDRAVAEMKRVCREGGLVAGYVWDIKALRTPASLLIRALQEHGCEPPLIPGGDIATMTRLESLFERVGLEDIATKQIEVSLTFSNFEDYWTRHTPRFIPAVKTFLMLPEMKRVAVKETVRRLLGRNADGSVSASVLANAVKARA